MFHAYAEHILQGFATTLEIALISLFFATMVGLFCALMAISDNFFLQKITRIYAVVIRGIPDLLLMLMLFYGGQIALNNVLEWLSPGTEMQLSQLTAGVITLGFIYGAYFMETFRGAVLAVPRGQVEAGRAFGMSPFKINIRILFPQMVRFALPGFANNWLVLSKATALVSVIGLQDVMYRAKESGVGSRQPFTWLLFAGLLYLLITSISLYLLRRVERKYSVGVRYGSHV
ncbi:ABC transporter permease [Collimonas pratensis]|uniref:Amino ABC transporter, permease, 3-TM region, His/Glu/Gln/Arg/opine family domain protein n=1 Tax=Collimonas pratensis TaxID=279113 RepID=A0ABM5Z5K0_9BURK|nr:ABC transporter permease subunit [Collimonas pratensis]AMP14396.1 amino ABC transporter, permease, 3-TM region, His/Glu/Gln/Arg/opine family domain protein [Collimonas pratensis]